jgi:hypothetical protein
MVRVGREGERKRERKGERERESVWCGYLFKGFSGDVDVGLGQHPVPPRHRLPHDNNTMRRGRRVERGGG